jgi:hypothetical protein
MNNNSQIKASEWTEIGQAEVVHTIFGKAKVRVIRKHDKMRRALYLLAIGVAFAIAWEGWVLYQHVETQQEAVFIPQFSTKIEASPTASKPEGISVSSTTLPVKNNSKTSFQTNIGDQVANDKNKPELPHDLSNTAQIIAKPIIHHPISPIAPQSAPNATNGNQSDKTLLPQQLSKQSLTKSQRVAPTGASSPSAVSPIMPLGNEGLPRQATGEMQFMDPINAKH